MNLPKIGITAALLLIIITTLPFIKPKDLNFMQNQSAFLINVKNFVSSEKDSITEAPSDSEQLFNLNENLPIFKFSDYCAFNFKPDYFYKEKFSETTTTCPTD